MTKILIVDDSKLIAKLLSEMLSKHGYEVVLSHSVNGAIQMLQELDQGIHVVITDLIMPDRDGIELIDYIYDNIAPVKRPKIIVISGGSKGTVTAETAVSSVRDKVNMVLVKPFSQEVLLESVQKVLA